MSELLLGVLAFHLVAFMGIQAWLLGSWARWRYLEGQRVGLSGVVRMLARETLAVYTVASYYVRALGRTGLRTPPQPQGRPVLCVHGITQNGTNMWGVRMALESGGRPTLAVHLGRPFQALDGYAPRVVNGLEALLELNDRVDVVCHSMGGIILRKALAARPDLADRVHHIITLGSPHKGTHAARGFEWFARDVGGLATGSAELAALPSFRELVPDALVTTVSGSWDVVVYPQAQAHLPGTNTVRIPDIGHVGLIADRRALRIIADTLA